MALIRSLSIALFMVNSLFAMSLPQEALFVPQRLGDVEVSYQNDTFMINDTPIHRYDLDPVLREVKNEDHLKALLSNSKISVSQYDNGEYKLATMGGLDGGGKFGFGLGLIGYVAIKGAIPIAMGVAAWKSHRQDKKERKARKKYLKRHRGTTKEEYHQILADEHFGSTSENIATFAERGGAFYEGNPSGLVVGEGISYTLDELGSRGYINNDGDRTYQATVMGLDQGSVAAASASLDSLANYVLAWCSALPF